MAVAPGYHRKACEAAFGRFRLKNKRRCASDDCCGLLQAVGKFHAIPPFRSGPVRGAGNVVERL
jgi:hypothetical protein